VGTPEKNSMNRIWPRFFALTLITIFKIKLVTKIRQIFLNTNSYLPTVMKIIRKYIIIV